MRTDKGTTLTELELGPKSLAAEEARVAVADGGGSTSVRSKGRASATAPQPPGFASIAFSSLQVRTQFRATTLICSSPSKGRMSTSTGKISGIRARQWSAASSSDFEANLSRIGAAQGCPWRRNRASPNSAASRSSA